MLESPDDVYRLRMNPSATVITVAVKVRAAMVLSNTSALILSSHSTGSSRGWLQSSD